MTENKKRVELTDEELENAVGGAANTNCPRSISSPTTACKTCGCAYYSNNYCSLYNASIKKGMLVVD